MKKILVPIDGSIASINAAKKAVDVAKHYGSSITFISVAHLPDVAKYEKYNTTWFTDYEKMTISLREEEEKMVDSIIRNLDFGDIKCNKIIITGEPYDEILNVATEGKYDLIVMGRRGFSKIKRFFVGSVTQRVIAEAPCPVLVVQE
jgi:nucleotide-binding universal stress UspA family protein